MEEDGDEAGKTEQDIADSNGTRRQEMVGSEGCLDWNG